MLRDRLQISLLILREFLNSLNSLLIHFKFVKKRLQHRSFPVNIAKVFRTAIFYRTLLVAAALEINQLIERFFSCFVQTHTRKIELKPFFVEYNCLK